MGFRLVSRTYETKEFFFGEHRGTQIPKILKSKIILFCVFLPVCASHGRWVCENLLVGAKRKSRYRGPVGPRKIPGQAGISYWGVLLIIMRRMNGG